MEARRGNGFTWYWTPEVWQWNPAEGPWHPKYGAPSANAYLEVSCGGDSSGEPVSDPYTFWREYAFYNFDPDPPSDRQKTRFYAEAKSFYTERVQLHTYRSDAITGRRSRKQARADSGSLIDIGLVIYGTRWFTPDLDAPWPTWESYEAGSFFVYDPARPCRSRWQAHEGLHLTFHRTTLEAVCGGTLPEIDLLIRHLNTSRLAPFLRSQLVLLSKSLGAMSQVERQFVLENAIDLLFSMLQISDATTLPSDIPPSRGLFVAAQRYIDTHLSDPSMNAARIAHAIGCSRATLYRVFADENLTVADYVRKRRLALSLQLLHDSPGHITVATIAHRCGFGDLSHFTKLFKRTYGMRPSDVRRSPTPAND